MSTRRPARNKLLKWHRYYHAELGRFVDRDRVGREGGTNIYAVTTDPRAIALPRGRSAERTGPLRLSRDSLSPNIINVDGTVACVAEFGGALFEACDKVLHGNCIGTGPTRFPGEDAIPKCLRQFCNGTRMIVLQCPEDHGPFARWYCGDTTCAFAIPHGRTIYICPAMRTPGCGSYASVILHEMVHLCGDPGEKGPESCEQACFGTEPQRDPKDCPGNSSQPLDCPY